MERPITNRIESTIGVLRGLAVIRLDADGRIAYWNAGAEDLFRWTSGVVLGRHLSMMYSQEAQAAGIPGRHLSEAVLRGLFRDEFALVRRDGSSIWTDLLVEPDDGLDGDRGFMLIAADISDRKQREAERDAQFHHQEQIAEKLQRSLLLVSPNDAVEGMQVVTQYESASQEARIGGDYYDVYRIDARHVALIVGDVTGKGLTAAIHTAEVNFALRAFLHQNSDPGMALQRLDTFLIDGQELGNNTLNALVSLALVVVDTETGAIALASAGAEPALIVRAGGQIDYGKPCGGLLGVNVNVPYGSSVDQLDPGDLVALATDGITEARFNKKFFGISGLADELAGSRHLPYLTDVAARVFDAARNYAGGQLQDDACLLLARRK